VNREGNATAAVFCNGMFRICAPNVEKMKAWTPQFEMLPSPKEA
jgi:hypothetical protein